MKIMKRATVLLAASAASAAPSLQGAAVTGKSTHYGGNLSGGTCSFTTYTLPSGIFGTAFSGSAWDGASACGACVEVTGPKGNKIKAMIVDKCPECDAGHLDLFINAFGQLDEPGKGIISTSYNFVPCGITTPIKLHNKSGTSPYWFSMQVVNANEPIKSLEVSIDGGSTWQATQRQDYNFFENPSGFGTEKVDVRVTSVTGKVVVAKGVSIAADSETAAGANFGASSGSAAEPPAAPKPSSSSKPSTPAEPSQPAPPPANQPQPEQPTEATEPKPTTAVDETPAASASSAPASSATQRPKCKRSKGKKSKRKAKQEL
ncbi:Expansin-YoaJ [Paramyrothecium foliicola]|nr:Expansin-YoaJ [Paramyrothecium foliicola]